jgi:hypothetical protein
MFDYGSFSFFNRIIGDCPSPEPQSLDRVSILSLAILRVLEFFAGVDASFLKQSGQLSIEFVSINIQKFREVIAVLAGFISVYWRDCLSIFDINQYNLHVDSGFVIQTPREKYKFLLVFVSSL